VTEDMNEFTLSTLLSVLSVYFDICILTCNLHEKYGYIVSPIFQFIKHNISITDSNFKTYRIPLHTRMKFCSDHNWEDCGEQICAFLCLQQALNFDRK
jgi:hypothetical protein